MRWIGIDEAGYGPNLGPLVMTAVEAESVGPATGDGASGAAAAPDVWTDLAPGVDRAGGDPARLWVDDSKAILRGGKGRDRLELACVACIHAAGRGIPATLAALLDALGVGAGAGEEAEWSPWFDELDLGTRWPWGCSPESLAAVLDARPLEPAVGTWRVSAVDAVVVGPARFNAELGATGLKSDVHFAAFRRLLGRAWERAGDGRPTIVTGDKHGGRHYYLEPLSRTFPGAWIERGPETPELSRYTIRDGDRRLELTFRPRADRENGLVALASIVSKAVRELWMDGFNAYWRTRIPGLRPTAGYPTDARRFRLAIEPAAVASGLDPGRWWRVK
ncbi:MAG: hypothetical protein ACYC61_07650 [Isosphaeraceae bacterium]